jgi:hypothetical protein
LFWFFVEANFDFFWDLEFLSCTAIEPLPSINPANHGPNLLVFWDFELDAIFSILILLFSLKIIFASFLLEMNFLFIIFLIFLNYQIHLLIISPPPLAWTPIHFSFFFCKLARLQLQLVEFKEKGGVEMDYILFYN